MTDANPPNLEFSWKLINNFDKGDKTTSKAQISKINYTPRSVSDFGVISCFASNSIDSGECKIMVELGGKYIDNLFNNKKKKRNLYIKSPPVVMHII